MSFGVVQSAIAAIKSNRKLLTKRDRLKSRLSVSESEKVEFNTPIATEKEIIELRNKLKKENKKRNVKLLFILLIIIIVSILILYLL